MRVTTLPDRPTVALYLFGPTVRSRARSPRGTSLTDDPRLSDGRRCRPRMHALPNLAIQLHLVRFIRLGQVMSGDPGAEGAGVELGEGPSARQMEERRRVGTSSEGVPQRRGAGIVLAEWREAQELLDGAQDGRGRVERAVDGVVAGEVCRAPEHLKELVDGGRGVVFLASTG